MAGRPTNRSKAKDDAYFQAIKNGATIKQAALICGYSYQSVMEYKRNDPEFQKNHNEAMDYRFELYKEKAHEALMNGFKEETTIDRNGKTTTTTTFKQNPAHVKFMLKAHEAGKFNYEKVIAGTVESGQDTPSINLSKLSIDALEELLNAAEAPDDNEQ